MPGFSQNDFEEFFREARIDCSKPGFYDEPTFIEIEKGNPSFLEMYADYIDSMTFSSDYLRKAKSITLEVVEFVYEKLSKDGLKGACLDVCGIISRLLEKEGIWNYVIKGGLTIGFDRNTGLATTYCTPIMTHDNPAVLGHAWVVAPPFRVVDVAFSYQHYTCGEEKYLRGYIAEENVERATLQVKDLIDMDAMKLHVKQYGRLPTMQDIKMLFPALFSRIEKYGIFGVKLPQARLKYVSCAVSFCEAPLEEVANIKLLGKSPIELYKEFLVTKRNGLK